MDTASIPQPPRRGPLRWRTRRGAAIAAGVAALGAVGATIAVRAATSPAPVHRAAAAPAAAAPPVTNSFGALRQAPATSCDRAASAAGLQDNPGSIFAFGLTPPLLTTGCEYGTVTALTGTSLTIRTLDGTITVTRGPQTMYDRAGAVVGAAAVHTGDVIGVRPVMALFNPPGHIAAQTISVETGTFFGRVQSVRGSTVTIVTTEGRVATVNTDTSTRYVTRGRPATLHDVTPGSEVLAQGHQTGLASLTADRLIIG